MAQKATMRDSSVDNNVKRKDGNGNGDIQRRKLDEDDDAKRQDDVMGFNHGYMVSENAIFVNGRGQNSASGARD